MTALDSEWMSRLDAAAFLQVSMSALDWRIRADNMTVKHIGRRTFLLRREVCASHSKRVGRKPVPLDREPTHDEIVYLAGLFDGEGCLYINRTTRLSKHAVQTQYTQHLLVISVTNTNLGILHWLGETFGGWVHSKGRKESPQWQTVYSWRASACRGAHILRLILPYLRIKQAQAQLAIEFQDHLEEGGRSGHHPVMPSDLEWRDRQKAHISALRQRIRPAPPGAAEEEASAS